jgi:manganese/zinc/iron transport system permease protein
MHLNDLYIILTGSMIAAACGLLGCYLILRRMAMVADAISHAVLPGIVIAFLLSGSRDSFMMLGAAMVTGLFTTFLIEFLHKSGRLQSDASIGVTFTWLFALGVILISAYAGQVDLDQDCVLYGEIAYVPLDIWWTDAGVNLGPKALYIALGVLLGVLLLIMVAYKELFLTTFDPGYATAIGVSTVFWHFVLMGAVSMTTVASFEAVGAILVVALFIAPPATAYLLTDNFKVMLGLTVLMGLILSIGGYGMAVRLNASIAGSMATVAGILFALAFGYSRLRLFFGSSSKVDPGAF